ncbi:MAG: endonuclease Q family protein [Candidatus Micrarchaeia archaeon]
MLAIADLHIHSRFSRACSSDITVKGLENAAVQKGIRILASGDPVNANWLSELKLNLEEDGTGLFKVKGSNTGVRFMLGGELSTIYEYGGKSRRIHHCVFVRSFEAIDQLRELLMPKGNLDSDGRPTLMMSSAELVESALEADSKAFIFPAHAWTPYFGVLGSITGFDSIEEAYEDQAKHIHALETGLSSDPEMNWRLSKLDKYALVSNSDMHSMQKMGREANAFELDKLTYNNIVDSISKKDSRHFKFTIEYYPEEGKYHYDGHRQCNFSANPETYKSSICPVCGKKLVIGVLHRVEELADRPKGFVPKNAIPYKKTVPLIEVLAYVMHKSSYSSAVKEAYGKMIAELGSEFHILLEEGIENIAASTGSEVATAIDNIRKGNVHIEPGYDGVFGVIDLLNREKQKQEVKRQKTLFSNHDRL